MRSRHRLSVGVVLLMCACSETSNRLDVAPDGAGRDLPRADAAGDRGSPDHRLTDARPGSERPAGDRSAVDLKSKDQGPAKDLPPVSPGCGNGTVDPGEACDGANLNGVACSSLPGLKSGTLKCKVDCSGYDVSLCAKGTTIPVAGCAQSAVQTAINGASSGDTVAVGAGTCAWSHVTIPSTKGITLAGGTGGTTTITGSEALAVQASSTSGTRVTGFTFTGVGTTNGGDVSVSGSKSSAAYRIDHNVFTNSGQSVLIVVGGNGAGVIDHNTVTAGGGSETIHNTGLGPSDSSGWTDDLTPGGPQMVFIEDNTFNYTDTTYIYSALQSYYGARTVFRHNTLHFSQVDQHGTAGMIGARWYEIYENTFQPHGLNQCCYGALRAGSGLVFDNHEVGSPMWQPAGFDFYEEDTGTWPLAYQVGSGINGHTNQHATCASGARNSSPVYVWGNAAGISFGSQTPTKVVQGRDYIVSTAKPASLFRQQLSTDTCSTSYSYVPFAYPHPLAALP